MGAISLLMLPAFRELEAVYPQIRTVNGSARIRILAQAIGSKDALPDALKVVTNNIAREYLHDRLMEVL